MVDRKPAATSSASRISTRRGFSEPSSHHARMARSPVPVECGISRCWRVARHACVTAQRSVTSAWSRSVGSTPSSSINSSPYRANSRSASVGFPSAMYTRISAALGLSRSGSVRTAARVPPQRPRTCLDRPGDRRAPRVRGGEAVASLLPRRAPSRRTSPEGVPPKAPGSPPLPDPPMMLPGSASAVAARGRARPRGRR
jgi:hypothetical protein